MSLKRRAGQVRHFIGMVVLYKNWPTAVVNKYRSVKTPEDVTYELLNGVVFHGQKGPIHIQLLNDIWRDHEYGRLPEFVVQDGWTVVDLGAHGGVFTLHAALAGGITRAHAFEPEPTNARYLRKNVSDNRLANMTVHEAALWSESGHRGLRLGPSWTHSMVSEDCGSQQGSNAEILVRTLTPDDLTQALGGIDLLKTDIEGAEYAVVTSASGDSISRINRMVMGYHSQPDLTAEEGFGRPRDALQPYGFRCVRQGLGLLFGIRCDAEAQPPPVA